MTGSRKDEIGTGAGPNGRPDPEQSSAPPSVSTTSESAALSWPLVDRRRPPRPDAEASTPAIPLAPFRVLALAGSVVRGVDEYRWTNWSLVLVTCVISIYTLATLVSPIVYVNDHRTRLRTLVEAGVIGGAVVVSGAWHSPFALCLLPTAMLASFVGGTRFCAALLGATSVVIGLQHIRESGIGDGLSATALWVALLTIVGVSSGVVHHNAVSSVARQQAALDRVGRLAEANALLFELQRVAQTLPASLDLDDVLDSTVARVESLIDHSMCTVLLVGDERGRFETVRARGYVSGYATRTVSDLPAGLADALQRPRPVRRDELAASGGGVAEHARSGLYAVMRARGAVVGLIAVESLEDRHFDATQAEVLHGLTEPAGISIDNARLFRRLRIASADEERGRIARDLHDHIGSSLAYLGFELDRSLASVARGDDVAEQLRDLRAQVTSMIADVRETLYDLRSNVSESADLAATLREFVDRVRERSRIDIVLTVDQRRRIPLQHERELWQIAREALINVERHAQASQARVVWRSDEREATLTIRDNGVGLLFGTTRVDAYGMVGMRERAAAIGATLTTESTPAGTVITVCLPSTQGATP